MLFTVLALVHLVMHSESSRANRDEGAPPKVVNLFNRRAPRESDPDRRLARVFEDRGVDLPPPYAFRWARDICERYGRDEFDSRLNRYGSALMFALGPLGPDGLGLDSAAAHDYAADLTARRPRDGGVVFEIAEFKAAFEFLLGLPHYDPLDAHEYARKLAADANEWARAMYPEGDAIWREWFASTYARVRQYYVDQNFEHASELAGLNLRAMTSANIPTDRRLWTLAAPTYAKALAFALKPTAEFGLGLHPVAAHDYATSAGRLYSSIWIDHEAECFRLVYQKLIASEADQGFALSPESARDFALTLVITPLPAVAEDVLETLERRRVVPTFATKPIRDGGLGLAAEDAAAEVERWLPRNLGRGGITALVERYESVLPRVLARQSLDHAYDEVAAREQTLAWVETPESWREAQVPLTEARLPDVTLPQLTDWIERRTSDLITLESSPPATSTPVPRSLPKRLASCAALLWKL